MEMNKRHKPISEDSSPMEAENQDMPFVNDTLELAEDKHAIKGPYKNDSKK